MSRLAAEPRRQIVLRSPAAESPHRTHRAAATGRVASIVTTRTDAPHNFEDCDREFSGRLKPEALIRSLIPLARVPTVRSSKTAGAPEHRYERTGRYGRSCDAQRRSVPVQRTVATDPRTAQAARGIDDASHLRAVYVARSSLRRRSCDECPASARSAGASGSRSLAAAHRRHHGGKLVTSRTRPLA